ncbi:MAG TPA: META domain-containing protein, partial [Steroidobacteraceae bacterium]
ANRPRMEGSGLEQNVIVSRFIHTWPNQNCERSRADAPLVNTYWRIVSVAGQPVGPADGKREPHLLVRDVNGRQSYAATVGCNRMAGSLTLADESVRFSSCIATLMACPPPLDELEKSLGQSLAATQRWQIEGNTLEFLDAQGMETALFEAVHH